MRAYDYFNKRRVTLQDMNDMQDWIGQDIRNYIGAHYEKGIMRSGGGRTLGSSDFGFTVQIQHPDFAFNDPSGNSFDIPVLDGLTGAFFVDAQGHLFHISLNETYKPTPTNFQHGGNLGIPLANGDGDYYVWINYRTIDDTIYTKQDKSGATHYPRQYESYRITVVFNNPAQPPADVIYIGKITKTGTTLVADYSLRIFAGFKERDINISISSLNRPSVYANNQGNTPLSDHISAIGTGTVTPYNPHGIHPDNMAQINSVTDNIAPRTIRDWHLSAYGDGVSNQPSVRDVHITDYHVTHQKLTSYTDGIFNTWSVDDGNIKDGCITPAKFSTGALALTAPIGSVIMWAGPEGSIPTPTWLPCDGRLLDIATYSILNGILGNTWGLAGVTPGFFRIPDLRGMFIRGAYTTSGAPSPKYGGDPDITGRVTYDGLPVGGAYTCSTYQQDAMQNHSHGVTADRDGGPDHLLDSGPNHMTRVQMTNFDTGGSNGRVSSETRGMNACLYYIIKVL